MDRPTLEEQIAEWKNQEAISKMSYEEIAALFKPLNKVEFWIYRHSELLWHILWWNWFDIWEGTEDADKYRPWYMKIKRKFFGGN